MPISLQSAPLRNTRNVARFAAITLGFFILVVLWGAVVRASGSGGGCGASWPLCNGDFFPHHPRLATIIEFTHRSTSGICTVLDVVLIVWTFAVTPHRHPARAAVLWSAAFLVLEAGLGMVLVLRHYVEDNISTGRVVMQSIHFTNTLLLMASLALVAWFLRDGTSIAVQACASLGRMARDCFDDRGGGHRSAGCAGRYAVPFSESARGAGLRFCSELTAAGAHALDASCCRCRRLLLRVAAGAHGDAYGAYCSWSSAAAVCAGNCGCSAARAHVDAGRPSTWR